jgi:hypothetical protein
MKLHWVPIDIGDLMTIGEFIDSVHQGNLIDYDGFGYYSDGKLMLAGLRIYPSAVKAGYFNTSYSHVVWFNK